MYFICAQGGGFMLNADSLNNIFIATLTALLCPLLLNLLLGLVNKRNKINEELCKQMLFEIYLPLEKLTTTNLKWSTIFDKDLYMDQTTFIFKQLTEFYEKTQKDIRTEILVDPIVLKHLSFSKLPRNNLFFRLVRIWEYKCLQKNVIKQDRKSVV